MIDPKPQTKPTTMNNKEQQPETLAAPARNCDRFQTEREAFAFYIDHVPDNGNIMTGYPDRLFATKLVYGDAAGKGGAE